MYLVRTLKVRQVLKVLQDQSKGAAKRALAKWRFQVRQCFPFYNHKTQKEYISIENLMNRVNYRIQGITGKRGRLYFHELFVLLDSMCWTLERLMSNSKRQAFRFMRVLYEMEQTVVNNQQALLIRTLNVNVLFFRRHFGSVDPSRNVDLGPRAIVSILENSRKIRERRDKTVSHGDVPYSERFLDKLKVHKDKQRDADILLRGVWSGPDPFFRLRDFVMVKLLQRQYIKWMNIIILKLRFHRNLTLMTDHRRHEIESHNNSFRRTWARLFLTNMMRDKLEKICMDVMIAFEINKKMRILDASKTAVIQPRAAPMQLQVMPNVPDYEESIKEAFKRKLTEVKKVFAKHFLMTILRPGVDPKSIKRDLNALIVDTVYYMTCGVIQDVNNAFQK